MIYLLKIIFIFFIVSNLYAREIGETEITTEDGIEVYQNEKYYLLKKNVRIESDNFLLQADNVKIDFNKSLYDIVSINANGNVRFNSFELNLNGSGQSLYFEVKTENLKIEGLESKLITDDLQMYSNGYIKVNNLNGNFSLKGLNSKLINKSILVEAELIDGIFLNSSNLKDITFLNTFDKKQSYVKNESSEMYAKEIKFDNNSSFIELIGDVKIIRDGEEIIGDYGTLDTKNNSYKIKSNEQKKVKAIIINNEQ
tara:strand:+ start:1461 stop:2225 length:765 start_codon:yes stop_codon:yes gene_type:complete